MSSPATYVDASQSTFNSVSGDQINSTHNFNFRTEGDDEITTTLALQRLAPANMDAYDRPECLAGTRTDILTVIEHWVKNSTSSQNFFWLFGLAGSGKSAISTTISNLFREKGRLGAFIFFDRDFRSRSDPSTVVRTLAYQLGSFHPSIGTRIAKAIKTTPNICYSPIRLQFQKLVVEPLSSIGDGPFQSPLVIVIDALDECGNAKTRKSLLGVLAEDSARLPFVRTIMMTRAEPDIHFALESQPHICSLELDITLDSNTDDIMQYLRHRMSGIRLTNRHLSLPPDWPGNDHIDELSKRTHGLFVWAKIASDFIDGHDPRKRLHRLLMGQEMTEAEAALDNLYITALDYAGRWGDSDFLAEFHAIIGLVLVARDPLSLSAIDELLYGVLAEGRPSIHTILLLGCIVTHNLKVRVLHPSFVDFLSNRKRCGRQIWYIDKRQQHLRLAVLCLDRMSGTLRRNFCDLALSSRDVERKLPEGLAYSCIFWIEHIDSIGEELNSIVEHVDIFLHSHLLHWLEAMRILNHTRQSVRLLHQLLCCIRIHLPDSVRLARLVADACRFVRAFTNSIEEHPLLIYLTAVPFMPTNSILYKTFHDQDFFPWIAGGYEKAWSPSLMQILAHFDGVVSVGFSSDGSRIVSSSVDASIRIWDVASGERLRLMYSPTEGHGLSVNSVAFSPDGTKVVSASYDGTVRIWDTTTKAQVLQRTMPFGWANSVCFSPDGKQIVVGSEDQIDIASGPEAPTRLRGRGGSNMLDFDGWKKQVPIITRHGYVYVWDTLTGRDIIPSLCGHKRAVYAAVFSPDGRRVASSSADQTIRLWDLQSGTESLLLVGHQGGVYSVVFSADGTLIISGSSDKTIRIWDSHTGAVVRPPLEGHTECVRSVCISPDGTRIISGSDDKTIRMWDARSGVTEGVFLPLLGHEGAISSVAFSPDGQQIVSGSKDTTVRVWDVKSIKKTIPSSSTETQGECIRALTFSPDCTRVASGAGCLVSLWDTRSGKRLLRFEGHRKSVLSLAFSPDGQRLASGSEDKTIRVWNVKSGAAILEPLQGHQHSITSLLYTPDGAHIVSGSDNNTIRVWDATSGIMMFPIRGHPSWVPCVALQNLRSGRVINISECATRYSFPNVVNLVGDIQLDKFFPHHVGSGWIVQTNTKKRVSKLPLSIPTNTITKTSASKTTIAMGTQSGQVVIMHFPTTVLTDLAASPGFV